MSNDLADPGQRIRVGRLAPGDRPANDRERNHNTQKTFRHASPSVEDGFGRRAMIAVALRVQPEVIVTPPKVEDGCSCASLPRGSADVRGDLAALLALGILVISRRRRAPSR